MKIRVIHIILICILIILIPVFILVYNLYKENTLNLSNKSNEKINDIDEFNNIDFEEDIGIATLLKYYNNRIYGKLGNDEYLLYDFNEDGKLDCMIIRKNTDYLYESNSNNTSIDFYELSEESDEAEKIDSIYYYVEYSLASLNYAFVNNNETNEKELFFEYSGGDGLCYEFLELFKIKISKNFEISKEDIVSYSCNSELEEKLRDEIRKDTSLTENELDTKLYEAHTLTYEIDDKIVTEEDYNSLIKSLKDKYDLLCKSEKKSNLLNTLFNLTKEEKDYMLKNVLENQDVIIDGDISDGNNIFAFYDIDNDGNLDALYLDKATTLISIYFNSDNKLHFINQMKYNLDLFGLSIVKDNNTGINELYLSIAYACGDSGVSEVCKLEYNKEEKNVEYLNVLMHGDGGYYEDGDENSEFIEYNNYYINGEECSEKEYNEYQDKLENSYTLVKEIGSENPL